jgi:2-C-methyl-D-erythritol 4-phosphate cytidylyltransferase/2-C-methyl-D-erythritol 2,4-cyclodiphosphate synthase
VVVAAGSGSRLARAGLAAPKQFLAFENRPLFWRAALSMAASPALSGLVLVFAPDRLEESSALVRELIRSDDPRLPVLTAPGGARRQDSVRAGLAVLPGTAGTSWSTTRPGPLPPRT